MKTESSNCYLHLLAVFSFLAISAAKKACPVRNPNFDEESGVAGAIVDGPGNPNILYMFGPNEWPRNIQQCARACKRWPAPRGTNLSPSNGESGPCAYWVWMAGNGCYLFGCGVCTNFHSFVPPEDATSGGALPLPRDGESYCSGGGPGRKQCSSGVKGDPHYKGGDGSHFEFTGAPGKHYCLISDSHLHVNVYYGGRYGVWGNDTHRAFTWIRKVAVMWGDHSVVLEAREGAEWRYKDGYMSRIVIDDDVVHLMEQGDRETSKDSLVEVAWTAAKQRSGDDEIDVYQVTMGKTLRMVVKARPEVAHLRTKEDGVVHFTLEFPEVVLSDDAHGVLGQTYRPDHHDRFSTQETEFSDLLKVNVAKGLNGEGFIDGKPEDYEVSSLLRNDCKVARFTHEFADSQGNLSANRAQAYRKLLR